MKQSEHVIKRLLGVITLDQTYIEFSLPVITLIFFDPASRLFSADTSLADRSMWYGICISIPYFINLFFAPFLSMLSDEFGRRKFLLFEIISSFCFMLMAGFAILLGHLWLLLASFVVRGAFSRTNTTALAIIGDASSKDKKMMYMGYLQVAISIGACIGPMISGFFADRFFFNTLNFSLPFFMAACLAFINAVLTYFLIDETLQQSSSEAWQTKTTNRITANWLAVKHVITHPDILKTSLLLLLFQITWSSYYQFMPPLLKTFYHFDSRLLGIFIGMIAFWLIIGSGPVFKLVHQKLSPRNILNLSVALELSGVCLTLATYYNLLPDIFLWAGAMPMAMGDVLAYICLTTLYSNIVADHMQGKVMGVNFLIVGLIWASTGFIGGLLISYTPILPLLLSPAGVIAALLAINARDGRKLAMNYNI